MALRPWLVDANHRNIVYMQLHERITKLTRKIKHWSMSVTYPKAMAHLNHSIDLITGFYQRVILISGCYTHWRCYLKCFNWVQFHLWPVKRLWLHDVSHQLMRIRERLLYESTLKEMKKKKRSGKKCCQRGFGLERAVCAVGLWGLVPGSFFRLLIFGLRRTRW